MAEVRGPFRGAAGLANAQGIIAVSPRTMRRCREAGGTHRPWVEYATDRDERLQAESEAAAGSRGAGSAPSVWLGEKNAAAAALSPTVKIADATNPVHELAIIRAGMSLAIEDP